MTRKPLALAFGVLMLAGCSGSSGLSTSSVLGEDSGSQAPLAKNDPTSRAFQVGTVSARAVKCGFNFDPVKLRTAYLAYEAGIATSPADTANVEKIYDVAYNGVTKAVAGQGEGYCTEQKTKEIKQDLNRHLAGDYTPNAPKQVAKQEDGLFSGWFDGSGSDSGPKFGSDAWWEKQKEKTGQ